MKVEFLNPFVKAALDVLRQEIGSEVGRGKLRLESSAGTTHDVGVMIGITGKAQGIVLYSFAFETARNIVSRMMGQECAEFDALAQSGIAELGNVITGQASRHLAESGYICNISPPTLIIGKNTTISSVDIPRLASPILTSCGEIEIHLALREATSAPQAA